jgi:hypothetical protein
MVKSMIPLWARRILGFVGLILVSVFVLGVHSALQHSFFDATSASGITLLLLIALLMLFGVRKRLSFLPLLRASVWLKFHTYVGLLSLVVFVAHNGPSIPQGGLERLLAAVFVVTAISGIGGLILSRILPARLTAHGENLNYQQIPALCQSLREEVETLILTATESTDSSTIADFYEMNLATYFARPRFLWGNLFPETRVHRKLTDRLEGLKRYLNEEEEEIAEQLIEMVVTKKNLDVQWNLQSVLKFWLFIHVPLSFGLLALAAAHIALVWQFL